MDTLRSFRIITRTRRMALGWAQADLAARAGLSTLTINEWETGKRTLQLDTFVAIADALALHVRVESPGVGSEPPTPGVPPPASSADLADRVAVIEAALAALSRELAPQAPSTPGGAPRPQRDKRRRGA